MCGCGSNQQILLAGSAPLAPSDSYPIPDNLRRSVANLMAAASRVHAPFRQATSRSFRWWHPSGKWTRSTRSNRSELMMIALAALVLGCSACTNGLAVDGMTAERLKADVSTCQTTSGPGTVYVATDDGVLTSIDLPGGHRNWSVH